MASAYNFEYFNVTFPSEYVAHVEINRPEKLNAFKEPVWTNFGRVFKQLSTDPNVRSIILTGAGDRAFTAGLDVQAAQADGVSSPKMQRSDAARTAFQIQDHILEFQSCITAIEKCLKPVIAVLHGYSYGLAIDIACACDIRFCAADTKFCVKETDLGLAADIGTLQRLPKLGVPMSFAKEICYTARVFHPAEAERMGFVSAVLQTKQDAMQRALEVATTIAGKSPVAVQSTKHLIDWSRTRTVEEGLQYTAVWNGAMLQTEDMSRAMSAGLSKGGKKLAFEKL